MLFHGKTCAEKVTYNKCDAESHAYGVCSSMESGLKQLELPCVLNTIVIGKSITKKKREMNSVKNWLISGINKRECRTSKNDGLQIVGRANCFKTVVIRKRKKKAKTSQ